jgi:head-tail adaptor
MTMRIAERSAKVQFLAPHKEDDGYRRATTFEPVGPVIWCKHIPVSDGEKWRNGQVTASQMARFQCLAWGIASKVTPQHRLRFRGKDYEILGVKDIGDGRRYLEITAVAKV